MITPGEKYLDGQTESSLWIRDLVVISLKHSNQASELLSVRKGQTMVAGIDVLLAIVPGYPVSFYPEYEGI